MGDAEIICPVFPLPDIVFFPNTTLPLHIFEPRYRAMAADALAGNRVIAIAQLMPGWEKDYAGRPAIYRVATAGFVSHHSMLEDGRYDILLDGFSRVIVREELSDASKQYRLVRCELMRDTGEGMNDDLRAQISRLVAFCHRITELQPKTAPWLRRIVSLSDEPAAFSNLLAAFCGSAFALDGYDRQCLLEERDVARRLALVGVQLGGVLQRLANPPAEDAGEEDDE